MNKIIFFSGTHGSGKTTTIEVLASKLNIPIFRGVGDDHGNPCEKNLFRRQAYRLGKYFSDTIHIQDIFARSDKVMLVDRCIYDWLAYTETFLKQEWISQKEYSKLRFYKSALFDDVLMPRNIVWFDPPYEWSRERILKRWSEEKKKWKEDDFKYLKTLRDTYTNIYDKNSKINLLRLQATDINERVKIIEVFIKKLKK